MQGFKTYTQNRHQNTVCHALKRYLKNIYLYKFNCCYCQSGVVVHGGVLEFAPLCNNQQIQSAFSRNYTTAKYAHACTPYTRHSSFNLLFIT